MKYDLLIQTGQFANLGGNLPESIKRQIQTTNETWKEAQNEEDSTHIFRFRKFPMLLGMDEMVLDSSLRLLDKYKNNMIKNFERASLRHKGLQLSNLIRNDTD